MPIQEPLSVACCSWVLGLSFENCSAIHCRPIHKFQETSINRCFRTNLKVWLENTRLNTDVGSSNIIETTGISHDVVYTCDD